MKKAAVALVVLVILTTVVAEAQMFREGIVGDAARYVRGKLYKWAGLMLALAATFYLLPAVIAAAGFQVAAALAVFVGVTAGHEVRPLLDSLGLWPKLAEQPDPFCETAGHGWHVDDDGVYRWCQGDDPGMAYHQ